MPYIKKTWTSGEVVTAAAMNGFEDAVEDAVDNAETAMAKVGSLSFTINSNMELVVTMDDN